MKLSFGQDEYLMTSYRAARVFATAMGVRFHGKKRDHPRLVGLSAFDADKTIRLFCKLWEARQDIVDRIPSGDLLCSLPVYPNFNDKHGHRVAFANVKARPHEQKYTPALDVIEMFDQGALPAYRMLTRVQSAEGYPAYVPQTSVTDLTRDIMQGYLLPVDAAFVLAFGEATSSLTESQIVAIGRHETPARTVDSLVWEITWWQWWLSQALDELALMCDQNAYPSAEAGYRLWQCWSFALECIKKAGLNDSGFISDADHYAEALALLTRNSNGNVIPELLRVTHNKSRLIWGDARVSAMRLASFAAWTISTYLCGCLRPLPIFIGTRLEMAFSSLDDGDVERARGHLGKLLAIPRSATPIQFEVGWLASYSSEPRTELPRLAELVENRIDLRDFKNSVQAVINAVVENLVMPHIMAVEEES